MKGQFNLIISLVLGLAVIVFVGSVVVPGIITPGSLAIGECEVRSSGANFLVPSYGFLSCEAITPEELTFENTVTPTGLFDRGSWEVELSCPSKGGVAEECDFYFKNIFTTSGINLPRFLDVAYQVCEGTSCTAEETSAANLAANEEKLFLSAVPAGRTVKVRGTVGLAEKPNDVISIVDKHIAYGLFRFERGGKFQVSTANCGVPLTFDQCLDCEPTPVGESNPNSESSDTIYNNPKDILGPGEFSTYLKDWLVSFKDVDSVATFNGRPVDCSNRVIYQYETVQLESGCFAFPGNSIQQVTCCPGEREAGKVCNDEFEWTFEDIGCIEQGLPTVTKCDGQGAWVRDFDDISGRRFKRATQCTDAGQCLFEFATAACSPPNNGCIGGVCVGDQSDPSSFQCIGEPASCGDENGDCFDDCTYESIFGCTPGCADEGESTRNIFGQKDKVCCGILEENDKGFCFDPDVAQISLLKAVLIGAVTSFVILIVLVILGQVFPPLLFIRNRQILVVAFLIMTLLFAFVFVGIAQAVSAMIGVI